MLEALVAASTGFALTLSCITILSHLKNYRVVTIQRLVVRILFIVPLYSLSAASLFFDWRTASILTSLKELYEAFVIYTFYTLLITVLGGEREIILSTAGRPPRTLPWPLKLIIGPTDISNPPTFLLIKQALFQYVWIQIALTSSGWILGKHTLWLVRFIIFNISLTIALNALSLFWFCLYSDLKPYSMFMKFACIKLVVFFSTWQTLVLVLAHKAGLVQDTKHFSSFLLSMEMSVFAVLHAIAFSYHEFASEQMLKCGRLPIRFAIRDALGCRDIIVDLQRTFIGPKYGYRDFDSVDAAIDHPSSRSRIGRLRAGLRYTQNGSRHYWLPISSSSVTPCLIISGPDISYGTHGRVVAPELPAVQGEERQQQITWDEQELEDDDSIYEAVRATYGDPNCPIIISTEPERYVTMAERQRQSRRDAVIRARYSPV